MFSFCLYLHAFYRNSLCVEYPPSMRHVAIYDVHELISAFYTFTLHEAAFAHVPLELI